MNTQMFGNNVGAAKTLERNLAEFDITLSLASAGCESWFQTRDDYPEPDVTSVSERSADVWWGGTTDLRSWKPEQRRSDIFYTLAGLKLYPSFDKYGNRIIRHFIAADLNITVRISVRHCERGEYLLAECYGNHKDKAGRWVGKRLASYSVANPYSTVSEQRVTYMMMAWFDKFENADREM